MTKLSNKATTELTRLINDVSICEATYSRKLAEGRSYREWHNWVIYGYQARLELFDKFGIDTISIEDKDGYKFTIQDARDKVEKFWLELKQESVEEEMEAVA